MLSYRYDELKPDAVTNGLVHIDSVAKRMYDGPVLSTSPYQQRRFFSVALAGVVPVSGQATVYIGSDLWLGTEPAPSSLTIDFNDGLGPRTVAMNSTVRVDYTETKYSESRSPEAYATGTHVTVMQSEKLRGYVALTKTAALAIVPDLAIGLHATHTWNNEPAATALGWVKWGAGNTSGKFRKPLVFVEGIDFGCDGIKGWCGTVTPNQTGPMPSVLQIAALTGTYRNGSTGWNELVEYNGDFPAVEKLPALRDQLTQQGYDLVFLDFLDGATYI